MVIIPCASFSLIPMTITKATRRITPTTSLLSGGLNRQEDDPLSFRDMKESSNPLLKQAADVQSPQPQQRRRQVLAELGGLSLASLLVSVKPVVAQEGDRATTETVAKAKTIVVTGANSGVGYEACKRLALTSTSTTTLVLACRTLEKAQMAVDQIRQAQQEDGTSSSSIIRLIPAECNLASLASIQHFAQDFPTLLQTEAPKIDALCLNAGIARNTAATDVARTQDGFELTGRYNRESMRSRIRLGCRTFLWSHFGFAMPDSRTFVSVCRSCCIVTPQLARIILVTFT